MSQNFKLQTRKLEAWNRGIHPLKSSIYFKHTVHTSILSKPKDKCFKVSYSSLCISVDGNWALNEYVKVAQ